MRNKHIGSSLKEVLKEKRKSPEFEKVFKREQAISDIAQKVYSLRVNAGLTQSALAKKAHTTQQVVARIEGGRDSRIPSLELLNRLATVLGKKVVVSFA